MFRPPLQILLVDRFASRQDLLVVKPMHVVVSLGAVFSQQQYPDSMNLRDSVGPQLVLRTVNKFTYILDDWQKACAHK